MKKPTMRDIAKAAGTSAVTVSKALAGQPGMSEETRIRIVQTAERMGYEDPGGKRTEPARQHLDIGILDTMKDLFVNFIGAVVFCSFGFAFLKYGESRKAAAKLVGGLTLKPEAPAEEELEADSAE